jgi:hypothetical protein
MKSCNCKIPGVAAQYLECLLVNGFRTEPSALVIHDCAMYGIGN